MKKYIFIGILGFQFIIAFNQIIHIPGDYLTIQQGIDVAMNGDTILLDTGIYMEDIYILAKNVTLASKYLITHDTSFISQTVLKGVDSATVMIMEGSTTMLCGLTITNDIYWHTMYVGGGQTILDHIIFLGSEGTALFSELSGTKIFDCKFIENEACIYFHHGDVIIKNSIFKDNTYGITQGCFGMSLSIYNSLFFNNENTVISGNYTPLKIYNSTFANNSSPENDYSISIDSGYLFNCIVWNFSQNEISGSTMVQYSNVQGGYEGEGNINVNPQFVNTGTHPHQLGNTSPCIDAGIPDTSGLNLPGKDLMGNDRVLDGDEDGVLTIDMGAYEYDPLAVGVKEISEQNHIQVIIFPNPCSGTAHLRISTYGIPSGNIEQGIRILEVFTISGMMIRELVDEEMLPGTHEVEVDLRDLPAGIYYCVLRTGHGTKTTKLIKL